MTAGVYNGFLDLFPADSKYLSPFINTVGFWSNREYPEQKVHFTGLNSIAQLHKMPLTTAVEPAKEQLDLRAYGGVIENVKTLTPFKPDTPIEVLQKHLEEDGVLWVPIKIFFLPKQ